MKKERQDKSRRIIDSMFEGWEKSLELNKKMLREMKQQLLISLLLHIIWFIWGILIGVAISR